MAINSQLNKNRILKNSVYLYLRMLFTMWLNLYATKVVLQNLGVEDYGVYGIVGSIVSFATVITSGVTDSIQRFITFEIGKRGNISKIFSSSINVAFSLASFIILVLEIVGLWLLNNKLNIPEQSMNAAFWVFQISILTCAINLISTPYNALVVAFEKMDVFAYISVVQVIFTFLAAYLISFFNSDRLILYSIFLFAGVVAIRLMYQIYCIKHLPSIKYSFFIDKKTITTIIQYAGINTVNSVLYIIYAQGLAIMLNMTFGVAINAVYNIASQVRSSCMSFCQNVLRALSPQIVKTYANGEYSNYNKLVNTGTKVEVVLIVLIVVPLYAKMNYLLALWLTDVPDYTAEFVKCFLATSLFYAFMGPVKTAILATTNIKKFLILPDLINILSLPFCYFVANAGYSPTYVVIIIAIAEILTNTIRCIIAAKDTCLSSSDMLSSSIRCVLLVVIVMVVAYESRNLFGNTLINLAMLIVYNAVITLVLSYFIICNRKERAIIHNTVLVIKNRLIHHV